MKKTLDEINTQITYRISSCLGIIETTRYDQNIFGDIIETDHYGKKLNDIGQIKANKLLLSQAFNDGWGILDVCDMDRETLEMGEVLFDFEQNAFVTPIDKYYNDLWDTNVLILSRVEIYPEYRGMGIGKHLIKDLYNNFIQGCGLFVLKCFPLQAEAGLYDRHKEQAIKMKYDNFEKDQKKAFKKLQSYYKSLGFVNIPSISQEYMFMNPLLKNKKFDSIKLE